jgi:hypothetical protein
METANVEKLSKGPNQPFYQVNAASSFSCSSLSTDPRKSEFFFLWHLQATVHAEFINFTSIYMGVRLA